MTTALDPIVGSQDAFVGESREPHDASGTVISRLRDELRVHHMSRRTEEAYVGWVGRFLRFHGGRHPVRMGGREVSAND